MTTAAALAQELVPAGIAEPENQRIAEAIAPRIQEALAMDVETLHVTFCANVMQARVLHGFLAVHLNRLMQVQPGQDAGRKARMPRRRTKDMSREEYEEWKRQFEQKMIRMGRKTFKKWETKRLASLERKRLEYRKLEKRLQRKRDAIRRRATRLRAAQRARRGHKDAMVHAQVEERLRAEMLAKMMTEAKRIGASAGQKSSGCCIM